MPLVKECFGSLLDAMFDRFENLIRVMINPSAKVSTISGTGSTGTFTINLPRMGIQLAEFNLMLSYWVSKAIED